MSVSAVRPGDALLVEEFHLGGVALDDQGAREMLAQMLASRHILVDDGEVDPRLGQLVCEIIADIRSSGDHDGVDSRAEHAQVAEEFSELRGGGGDVYGVALTEDEIAGGDLHLALSLHGADQDLRLDVRGEVRQLHFRERAALGDKIFDKLDSSLRERLALQRGGESENSGNLMGGRLFGIYGHGQAEIVPHEAELLFVPGIADSGYGMGRAEFPRQQTDQHVDLVRAGGGDDKVRLARSRVLLDAVKGAVSAYSENVAGVHELLDHFLSFLVFETIPTMISTIAAPINTYLRISYIKTPPRY